MGHKILLRWNKQGARGGFVWYEGVVDEYSDEGKHTGEHHITYVDNDKKWYVTMTYVYNNLFVIIYHYILEHGVCTDIVTVAISVVVYGC